MDSARVRSDFQGPLAVLTLAHPERRNALSSTMMRALLEALNAVSARPEVKAVILAAEGPVFSAGHDLREMTCDCSQQDYRALFELCTDLMEAVQSAPQPVIAQVQGMATAAGCQLVATCDLAIASERASFATPGVKIGLFCSTPMVALSRAIGRKRAMEMLLTGKPIDAATAADWGLINRSVPHDELEEQTRALALAVADASAATVGLGKAAFYEQIDLPQVEAYNRAKRVMCENAALPDAQEGMAAFLEKRKPEWKKQ
ncbi:MAG: enoyl-CoA hydratase [Bryobacterales bacterium]